MATRPPRFRARARWGLSIHGRREAEAPGQLVDRRRGRVKAFVTIDQTGRHVQPVDLRMPEGLEPEARRIWEETVAGSREHLFPADAVAARRWIHWVNEWLKATERLAEEGVVIPGRREPRLNPLVRYVQTCEENIARSETVMGFNPLARMRLGITFAVEQSAIATLKRSDVDLGPTRMGGS